MQRSPCHECEIHLAGGDKNGDRCLRCTKRIEYVAALEGRSASMPVEMTDMARWTPEEVKYLRDNFEGKTDSQIGAVIGRSGATVMFKRHSLGLKKAAAWRAGWERIKERKAAAMAQAEEAIERLPKTDPPHEGGLVDTSSHCDYCGVGVGMLHKPGCGRPPHAEVVSVNRDFTLINFKKHEAIYGRLQAAAERDFRTPELQALFYIHQALEREDGAGDQRRAADFTR